MLPQFNIGKSGENYVKYLFNVAKIQCELNNDYSLRYDYDLIVKIRKLKFTIEVKYDIFSVKSGNIAIEVFNCKSNRESGIYSTLADVWVHLIPEKESANILAYAIKTDKLKKFIETANPVKKITAGGDNNSNMLLFKKEQILPIFERFDNINNQNSMEELFLKLLKFPKSV